MKKAIRIILPLLVLYFLITWALAAISLQKGFGRRDQIPQKEPAYTDEMQSAYPRKEVTFLSGQNRLHGWLYTDGDPSDDAGLVIVAHGLGGGADSHLIETLDFVDHHYSVFSYDGTGTRESEGAGVRGLYQATLDLDAALDHVRETQEFETQPIFVYGHSAGGYAAVAVLEEHEEVDGIVSVCAFDRPLQEMMAQARKRAGFSAYLGYPGLALQYGILFGRDANRSAASILSKTVVPALIVAGSADEVVPLPVSLYGKQDLILDPNASFLLMEEQGYNGHTGLWRSADFMQAVLAFLREASALPGG